MKKILSKLSRGRRGATPSRSDSPRCAWVRRREAKRSKSPKGELAWWASPRAAGRSISVVALCSLLAGTLGGCSGPTISEIYGSDVAVSSSSSTSTSTEAASFEEVAAAFDVAALDLEYSNRDKDASYDDASATHIVLSGATATVDGDGASVEGSTVTISAEGTYVVSSTPHDGRSSSPSRCPSRSA